MKTKLNPQPAATEHSHAPVLDAAPEPSLVALATPEPEPAREPLYWAIAADGHGPAFMADVATDSRRIDRERLGIEPKHEMLTVADDPVPFFERPQDEAIEDKSIRVFDTRDAAEKISNKRKAEGKDLANAILKSRAKDDIARAERDRKLAERKGMSLREGLNARRREALEIKKREVDAHEQRGRLLRSELDTETATIDAWVEAEARRIESLPSIKRILDEIKTSRPSMPDSLETAVQVSRRHGVHP